jgi:hypothetical protein
MRRIHLTLTRAPCLAGCSESELPAVVLLASYSNKQQQQQTPLISAYAHTCTCTYVNFMSVRLIMSDAHLAIVIINWAPFSNLRPVLDFSRRPGFIPETPSSKPLQAAGFGLKFQRISS